MNWQPMKDKAKALVEVCISVPASTRHWFDMVPNPVFTALRLFNNPEGWAANFTGDDITSRFPLLEN
jgi:1,2-dihydroxy-3-keto-5-methylthiopentene dioxygenase